MLDDRRRRHPIDCYGLVEPVPTNAQQVGVNTGTFYDGATTASTSTTGLFGITNWLDIYSASSGSLASFGSTTGVFDIAANLTGSVAVMLKAGNTWVSYLYNGLAAGSYTFDLLAAGTGNALSNIRIISTNPIPLPAALPLLAGALGGLAWVGRRRRKAA